jgi:flagellar hook assembly protein FlgD
MFFIPVILFADINMSGVIAYPVPFNPNTSTNMSIRFDGVTVAGTIKINIYDVNGDLVFSQNYSLSPAIWNGRNDKGRLVAPGMYIIKVELQNNDGGYGKKLIRILINY